MNRSPPRLPPSGEEQKPCYSRADELPADPHPHGPFRRLLPRRRFSRVGAVVGLKVRDYEHQRRRAYLALREKGAQHRRVPVHSRAAEALDAYLAASGLDAAPEEPLFQSFAGRGVL